MIYGIGVRLVAAALAIAIAGWGGWLYRGYTDAQRASSQAVEASVKAAASALKRDSQSLSDRRSAIAKTEPTLTALRGWQGGLKRKENNIGNHAETAQEGPGCSSDPWGSPEYLRVLGDAARAGNQALDTASDVPGAVQEHP